MKQFAASTGTEIQWQGAVSFSDIDALPVECHPVLRAGAEHWYSIHPDRGLPGRQHLDPIAIPKLLAHVRLVDVVGEPPRFRVRLTGTHVESHMGLARPGAWFDELFDDFGETETHEGFITAVRTRQPNWRRGLCEIKGDRAYTPVERIQLPFASDGETVDMIMVVVVFDQSSLKLV